MERPAMARFSRPLATLYSRSTDGMISSVRVLPKSVILRSFIPVAAAPVRRYHVEVTIAPRHDDDHGHDLAISQHSVQHQVGPASGHPTIFRIGKTVQQIQYRIATLALCVIPGRGVDHVGSLVVGIVQTDVR